jgi:Zn-dependent protease
MRDPLSWSFPIGQIAGVAVRMHVLMPIVMIGFVLREAFRKDAIALAWADAAVLMILLFLVVLLHEFGHCFVARLVGGEAREVMLWPLGGLAHVDVPHAPSAHFWTALGGPFVNLVICAASALALAFAFDQSWQPPWNPLPPAYGGWQPYRETMEGSLTLSTWSGESITARHAIAVVFLARLFFVSWLLLLLNVLLIGFPLDGGRMFQAALWPWFGYRGAMRYAVFTGFFVMFLVLLAAFVLDAVLCVFLAYFIFAACKQEWLILEGGGEESLFGYDFSQGYTSLEKEAPPAPRRQKQNFFQRWLQRRKQQKEQRDQERQQAEERRMDELLQKIHDKIPLTVEEQRFMKRFAERYKNRQ